jgi:hypothetical protein
MPNGCIEWTKTKTKNGYGQLRVDSKNQYVHRLAASLVYGKSSLDVLHSCDNPSCINPDHLRYGTARENAADMVIRGRARYISHYGENCGTSKLTNANVLQIRELAKTMTYPEIGKIFGVHKGHVKKIVNRKAWTHI